LPRAPWVGVYGCNNFIENPMPSTAILSLKTYALNCDSVSEPKRHVLLQGALGETFPSVAGPYPLLVQQADGKLVSVNRTHPILPVEAYERKGFPSYLEGPSLALVGRAMFAAGSTQSSASRRPLAHPITGAAFSRKATEEGGADL
jgi:hypothetical protein